MQLRDIKLASILLRTKANKKALKYGDAFNDAKKLWALMSPQERVNNSHFKETYLNELSILNGHFEKKDTIVKIDRDTLYDTIKNKNKNPGWLALKIEVLKNVGKNFLVTHYKKISNILAFVCLMASISILYKMQQ